MCICIYMICSFTTEQDDVVLYMTAIASLSTLVQKPIVKVLNFLSLVNGNLFIEPICSYMITV